MNDLTEPFINGVRRFWQQVVVVSCGFILEKVPVLSIY